MEIHRRYGNGNTSWIRQLQDFCDFQHYHPTNVINTLNGKKLKMLNFMILHQTNSHQSFSLCFKIKCFADMLESIAMSLLNFIYN